MNTKEKGALGESIASEYLKKRGYVILARNYRRKWGELDLVAQKDGMLHFVEVKSVLRPFAPGHTGGNWSHEPEENVHTFKLHQIRKMVKTYMTEEGITRETAFQFHVMCVYLDIGTRKARIKWLKDIVL